VLRLRRTIEESLRRVVDLMEALLAARPREIDPARLVLCGASMGAYGTWDLLVRFPRRFAAAVAIAGSGDPAHPNVQVLRDRVARRELRLWAFHSLGDAVVTPNASRRMFDAIADGMATHVRLRRSDVPPDGRAALELGVGRRQARLSTLQSDERFAVGGWLVHTEYGGSGVNSHAGEWRLGVKAAPSHTASFTLAVGDPRLPGWSLGAAPDGDWES
jgi:pimeloyl-ACP methyl ester carboxylesterase